MNCNFGSLTDPVLLNVFSYLELRDLAQANRVCKSWNRVSNDDTLWKSSYDILSLYRIGLNINDIYNYNELKSTFIKRNISNILIKEISTTNLTAFTATFCLYKLGLRDIEELVSSVKKLDPKTCYFQYKYVVDELLNIKQPGLCFDLVENQSNTFYKKYILSSSFEFLSCSEDFEIAYSSIEKPFQENKMQALFSYDFIIKLAFYACKKGKIHITEKLFQLVTKLELNPCKEAFIRQAHKTLISNDFISNLETLYPEICKSPLTLDDIAFYMHAEQVDLALEILQEITDPELRRHCIFNINANKGSYQGPIPTE